MSHNALQYLAAAGVAAAAGFVNALAGGGTLLSFPALILLGVPPVAANVTNTLALLPGYLSAAHSQRRDILAQRSALRRLLPLSVLGGLAGALALLATGEALFRRLVPFLLYLGVGLIAAQGPVKAALARRRAAPGGEHAGGQGRGPGLLALVAMGAASVYGGYFGAGVSIVILAVLSLSLDEDFGRLNALKQVLALGANLGAAVYFGLKAPVLWPLAGAMALGALLGGSLGGRLASKVRPQVLKAVVVLAGAALATFFLVSTFF